MMNNQNQAMSNKKDKKTESNFNVQLKQGNNSLAIIGNAAPVDLNIKQTVYVQNGKVTPSNENNSDPRDSSTKEQSKQKKRPVPKEYTIAKIWTKEDGSFCLSTETNTKYDGKVEFPLNNQRKATKQMQLMMLLCHNWPDGIHLSELIKEVYPDEMENLREKNLEKAKDLLKKLRSLVSDTRKRMARCNINPNIISSLGIEANEQDSVTLYVKHLNNMDDKKILQ